MDAKDGDEDGGVEVDHQQRRARLEDACGCDTGAAFSLVALVALTLFRVVRGPIADGTFRSLALGAAIVVLAGAVGKGVGLLWARLQLRRLERPDALSRT